MAKDGTDVAKLLISIFIDGHTMKYAHPRSLTMESPCVDDSQVDSGGTARLIRSPHFDKTRLAQSLSDIPSDSPEPAFVRWECTHHGQQAKLA
jgi:hypothetical protein